MRTRINRHRRPLPSCRLFHSQQFLPTFQRCTSSGLSTNLGYEWRYTQSAKGIARIAERAVQLQRGIDHLRTILAKNILAIEFSCDMSRPIFRLIGNMHQHQSRFVNFCRTIGQHELHAFAVGQFLTESFATQNIFSCHIQRPLCFY